MSSADWQLDPAELASKFSERTKAIVLNSPNNPLGKVTLLAMLGPGGSWGATFAGQQCLSPPCTQGKWVLWEPHMLCSVSWWF